MIKCLSKEVQAKLRSGVAIPSLQQCVEELILNSIDAGATCVGVRTDMEAFRVQVIDNGAGMSAEDMEWVGSRYHTSKCNSVDDLDNLRFYGFRGEAVASIVSLATLVEISSRARSSVKTLVRMFKNGKGLDVFETETGRPSAGTTVVICNFFHNMPVRRKRMDAVLEGERIRHRVEAISLMHPSVSFSLKNDCTGAMMVQLPKARDTYHRFAQIHSLGRAQKLGEIRHTHAQFEVVGFLGREGHYNNSLHYLYVNSRLLLKTRIHKLLNFLLRRLSSSNQKNDSPDKQFASRSPKQKRSQELYGVYIINIKCSYSEYDICLEPAKTLIEFKDWDGILICIEEAVKAFLRRENLVAVISQDDFDSVSPQLFGTDITDEGENKFDKDAHAAISTSALDCGMTLASESVHRKREDHILSEDSVGQKSDLTERKEGEEKLGEERIAANELENIQSEGGVNKCRDQPHYDLAGLESDHNIQTAVSETGAGKEMEIELKHTASTSNINSFTSMTQDIHLDSGSIKQIDHQGAGEHEPTLIQNKKIRLTNPYSHESLQTQDLSQINSSVFHLQDLAGKCASKRKISLDAGHNTSCQKVVKDSVPVIPSKIPKVKSCENLLSLSTESGSLDKFRRIFGKSNELKAPSPGTHSQDNARRLQTDNFALNSQNLLIPQKERQQREDARSAFTKLKEVSGQIKARHSLAAKLNRFKQNRTEDVNTKHVSRSMLHEETCHSSNEGFQDSNNNENAREMALDAEPVPADNTEPQQAEREEATTSGDWLHHYDERMGRTGYVNKVTGLSRYEEPPMEETQVCCTSDVTNMAVSVVTEMGMEYRCYPFQGELVLPFLPKSRAERVVSSGADYRGEGGESSNSLSSLYSKWNNPVFVRPPMVGVDISSRRADELAVKIHNILFPYRFSKAMIHSMKVINQVDKKFLACLINTRDEDSAALPEGEGNLLVLLDQHAAHERVRLENLVADSYEDDPNAPGERRLCTSSILPPLEILVTEEEFRLLRSCQAHLRSLGLEVKFSQATDPQVLVGKVPLCFMEKESNELRRGRASIIKPIVGEYLREQIELLRSTGRVRGTLPLTVLKVLASLACHGAIKFNDSLSRDECHSLVASLSSCQLPFQCAHGRPSIAPLVDILHLDTNQKEVQKPNLRKLRRMYKAWELYGNG